MFPLLPLLQSWLSERAEHMIQVVGPSPAALLRLLLYACSMLRLCFLYPGIKEPFWKPGPTTPQSLMQKRFRGRAVRGRAVPAPEQFLKNALKRPCLSVGTRRHSVLVPLIIVGALIVVPLVILADGIKAAEQAIALVVGPGGEVQGAGTTSVGAVAEG